MAAFIRAGERTGGIARLRYRKGGSAALLDRDDRLHWFKTVILPFQPVLRRRLRRLVRDADDLDDLVAEVLARTYAYDGWRDIRHGLAFMTRAAHNILIDQQRREVIVSIDYVADLEVLQRSISYDEMFDARDALRHLESVVETLSPQPRRAFLLRRVQGHSVGEVAEIMGISVSTVEKHLAKALARVARARAEQEDQGVVQRRGEGERAEGDPRRGGDMGRSP
ncbi:MULTISPECIES: sigma-70 family RNA polymerase sigma factor [unclassified Sphingomonas]|uniref:sigma-70 family RNA polymerase sigma factor n=1 Tax=unclassified Sphingomonas TaxID=196159 RepID=UPI001AC94F3B|nr:MULTISPECIES: sigma-70 family RNA polymerase sigma factor [unclassified Sphingomonas]MBN8850084.1 sigma-70 family RNA polymerase sigma factor [Sphingomonas sp.]